MNKLFKIFLVLFVILGFTFIGINQAYAFKWNRAFIVIYIPKNEIYTQQMENAIGEWQKLTKRMLLMPTTQPKDLAIAEVETVFNKVSGENAKNACKVFHTQATKYFKHAKIVIDVNETPEILSDCNRKKENDTEIYTLMIKSIGTMLGVPESDDEKSVMYPEYKKGQSILPSDINNFKTLYNLKK